VIYGSSGFNWYGYHGGCTFANGTVEEVYASPTAARYFCGPGDKEVFRCTTDHAASAYCYETVTRRTADVAAQVADLPLFEAILSDADDYISVTYLGDYVIPGSDRTEGFQDLTEVCSLPCLQPERRVQACVLQRSDRK
jgi:hypothetical protein